MADADTRSLQQIKSETEQTRAGLTSTVEQLKTTVAETVSDIRHRISPDAIKAEVSNYIRSRGEQLMNDVTSAARRNPMQAVAVGASIAYPVLKIARAIPLPILMVGAGLFFAGSKTGQAATQKASDMATDLSEEMVRRAHDLRDQMQDNAASVTNYA
jgi:preprotein translocase subunit SecD